MQICNYCGGSIGPDGSKFEAYISNGAAFRDAKCAADAEIERLKAEVADLLTAIEWEGSHSDPKCPSCERNINDWIDEPDGDKNGYHAEDCNLKALLDKARGSNKGGSNNAMA